MGQKPADIEQEIRQAREDISRRVDGLKERGASDFREAADGIQRLVQDGPIGSAVEQQPLMTLAGAMGVGVVIGMASGKVYIRRKRPSHDGSDDRNGKGSSSTVPGVLSGLIASLEAAAVDEGREMLRQYLSSDERPANGHKAGAFAQGWTPAQDGPFASPPPGFAAPESDDLPPPMGPGPSPGFASPNLDQ